MLGDAMATDATPTNVQRSRFPRKHLVPGETIQWEGRPSVIVYFLRSLLLFIFGAAFAVFGHVQSSSTIDLAVLGSYIPLLGMFVLVLLMVSIHRRWGTLEGLIALVLVIILALDQLISLNINLSSWYYLLPMVIGLVAFLFEFVLWSHTYFAISDRRIMTQYGVFNLMFADVQIDRIQNVSVVQPLVERMFGFGDVMFATAGEMGGIESDDPNERLRRGGAIIWDNVPKPFEVRRIAEEIILRSTQPAVRYVAQPAPVQYVQAPAPVAPIASVEAEERLLKLKEMRERNIISEEEYQQKRAEILGRL